MSFRILLSAAALLLAQGASAAALDDLHAFLDSAKSARASFSQTVFSRNGKVTQRASGSFSFQKPGRFRFVYQQPYAQIIVGDGQKLWTYDKELNQVTVKPVGKALGATPAALLTGDGQLERNFTLRDGGEAQGLAWVDATPKQQDAGFEKVRIAFRAGALVGMEVHDNFGQTTFLKFSSFERNVHFDAAEFRFTPPKGADVVGE